MAITKQLNSAKAKCKMCSREGHHTVSCPLKGYMKWMNKLDWEVSFDVESKYLIVFVYMSMNNYKITKKANN